MRSHYFLEAGWRADNAIQGLGRSHRTNQASAPIFRPVIKILG
ncbi:strawberry notch C-terminal domain-containing protein [Nostoc sp.]